VPVLPGAQMPGPAQPAPRGNIGGLLPVITPSPAAFSPGQVRRAAFGRDDSVTMGGPGPATAGRGSSMLLGGTAVIVIAITGGWLAITGRGWHRRAR